MAKIYLYNKAKIDISKIEDVAKIANLPNGKLIIILSDKALDRRNRGICFPKSLIKYGTDPVFDPYLNDHWDCGIAISRKYCDESIKYPAYFSYLIGHELGHAHICLTDLELHIHCSLIRDFIREASKDKIKFSFDLPNEKLCVQYGIFITESIFSRQKLDEEIKQKLEYIEETEIRKPLENMLSVFSIKLIDAHKLRSDIVTFSKPYKDSLIELWEQSKEYDENSFAFLVKDYEELFVA